MEGRLEGFRYSWSGYLPPHLALLACCKEGMSVRGGTEVILLAAKKRDGLIFSNVVILVKMNAIALWDEEALLLWKDDQSA